MKSHPYVVLFACIGAAALILLASFMLGSTSQGNEWGSYEATATAFTLDAISRATPITAP